MGKLNPVTGALTGVVGTVTLSTWKGIHIMKSKRKATKERTANQLQNEARMGMFSKFIYSMRELLDKTFLHYAVGKTGTNAAFSFNYKNAVAGEYPDFKINYSQVIISRGGLPNATNPTVSTNADGEVIFTWTDNSGSGKAKANDTCIAVIHCPEHNQTIYKNTDTRKSGSSAVDAKLFKNKEVETWIGFMSANGKEVANSVYVGKVVVV